MESIPHVPSKGLFIPCAEKRAINAIIMASPSTHPSPITQSPRLKAAPLSTQKRKIRILKEDTTFHTLSKTPSDRCLRDARRKGFDSSPFPRTFFPNQKDPFQRGRYLNSSRQGVHEHQSGNGDSILPLGNDYQGRGYELHCGPWPANEHSG